MIDRPVSHRAPVVVAIPVHNEADRIGRCLEDLLHQTRRPDAVVCLLNNCTDASVAVVERLAEASPGVLHPVIRHLPATQANAGHARRHAMQHAARLAGRDGILITTDADTRIAADWVVRNLEALAAGADAVCGQAQIDPVEARAIPDHLHADDALECRYAALLDRIAASLDPDPADPMPRHTQESGASIAVRVAAYDAAGGIPAVPLGEDRAFVDALRRRDARIRHAPDISVVVSGRVDGRAAGGMADTIRRRMQQQDTNIDALLEPAADAYRRVHFRARLRSAWQAGRAPADLVSDLHVLPDTLANALAEPHFGAAWAIVQGACPLIRRRSVAFTDLPRQICGAEALLAVLALEPDAAGGLTEDALS